MYIFFKYRDIISRVFIPNLPVNTAELLIILPSSWKTDFELTMDNDPSKKISCSYGRFFLRVSTPDYKLIKEMAIDYIDQLYDQMQFL